ncbi:MAG TPA: ABC transporter ATP-binding protein [Sporosarcina sp.]|nr:ABC transporter ATP-binding protein [Sporosarcina sp.]
MLLTVEHLKKEFNVKKQKIQAVKSIDFELRAGGITAFLGPNGAGKTTTIKMIAGLIQPDEGDIRINGKSILTDSRRTLQKIGTVLEGSRNLYWRLSPLENFEYWGGIKGISREQAVKKGKELMHAFGLEDKMHHTVQQLSRGMQQRVAICTSLIHSPSLLLLDEPTLGLDLDSSDRIQALLKDLVKEQNVGILLTTHQMDVAEALSDRLAIINDGALVKEGTTHEVLQQFNETETYLFECAEPLSEENMKKLTIYQPTYTGSTSFKVTLTDTQQLYEMIRLLEPKPIVRIEKDVADVARVFRHYTQRREEGAGWL